MGPAQHGPPISANMVPMTPSGNPGMDNSCSRTTDPDIALSSIPGWDNTMAQVIAQATKIVMAPEEATWLLDTCMATGVASNMGLYGLWWQFGPLISTQTLLW